jgi:3-oxoadipate enol-lactonase
VRASLHVEELGPPDAPVVVLSPSLGTTGAMWAPQLPALAERFRVLVVDHRGHGRSEVVPGPAALDDLGADVLTALDAASVDRFSWVGLSLGGMVGMWIAAEVPERVERLALVCTAARVPPAAKWLDRAATVRAEGTGALADLMMGRWFTAGFAAREPATVDVYRAMLLATPDEGYAACCEVIAAMDLRPRLSAITAPTLVVAGADDPATPPSSAEEIVSEIPGARLEVVADAAHLANVEQPEAITKLLLEHLGPPS